MTSVIDSRHHESAVALFDDRDRCVLDSKWKQAVIRPAHDSMQRDLDHAAMRDDEDVAVLVARENRIQLSVDPGLERHGALAAGDHVPARLLHPPRPRFGEALCELFGVQAFPVAEVDLAKAGSGERRGAGRLADQLGGLLGALEVAGVEAGEPVMGQPPPQDRKSTRLNSSHLVISYAVFCLKKK